LCTALFGRDTPPMIFQYNALDYVIERLENGELVFTICRASGASPKIRYNLKDVGGTWTFRALSRELTRLGVDVGGLAKRFGQFPVLYVYGRSDLTAAFYGAKVYPADVEAVLHEHPVLSRTVHSFQLASFEDERVNRRLSIALELSPEAPEGCGVAEDDLSDVFYRGLARSNQDFREVTRMFAPNAIEVVLHAHGTGPFEGSDARLKKQYVRPE
jgi:phenylacetate-CoA ligase